MFAKDALSDDKFLDGRLRLLQPRNGYRAATDPVFLAAACLTKPTERVLDMGCGIGAAALCLGARVPDVRLYGIELQSDYADLARQNAQRNNIPLQVYTGDITNMPQELRIDFDHVIANPPYYPAGGTASPIHGRAIAMQTCLPLAQWVKLAGKRLTPGGWMTFICGADGLIDALSGLGDKLGSVQILPLQARVDVPAKRVLIKARKGGKAALQLLAPLIVHEGLTHNGDRESYTWQANAILRNGDALSFAKK